MAVYRVLLLFMLVCTTSCQVPPRITKLRYLTERMEQRIINPRGVIRLPEAGSLVLNVEVGSNPNPNVTLIRHNHVITWQDVAGVTGGYEMVLDNLQCEDTGTYDVRASNNVTQTPSERQFRLQVICAPRREDSSNSTIRLTGQRDQTISFDVIVIANPSPTIKWSDGMSTLSVVQNNNYTYTLRGTVLITFAEGYMYRHVNISNGEGKVLTVTFKIHGEGADNIQFKLPVFILVGVVDMLTLTIIALILVIRRQRVQIEQKCGENAFSDKNHGLRDITSSEDVKDGDVRSEDISIIVSNIENQTGNIKQKW